MTARLEREFRDYIGTDYALAVTSGSGALEVAMAAAGVGPGDEVIVTAWSWIACFTSIVRVGARPVLAEIDDTLNLDPAEIGRLATPRTRAVIVIHYQGVPAEMERIQHEAHRRGLFVIEDCAQAIGCSYRGRKVGTWSDLATFSFQANKTMTAGEGGMVVTRDGWLYERAVRFHDLGNYRPHHAAIRPACGEAFAGGQFRMSELTAAVALAQLRKLDGLRAHCRALHARIAARVRGLAGITLRRSPDTAGDFGFELYLFFADATRVAAFREKLDARNVNCGARTGTYPQYYRDYVKNGRAHTPAASPFCGLAPWPAPGYRAEDFPRTEELTKRFVALPLGWLYTIEDAAYIAECIVAVHAEVFGPA
jgi:dTDP-4-amino-4,6-dideoxygalactose transaminase